jgi:hypothetical protein
VNPDLSLCGHLSALACGGAAPELAHAFLWQDGAIDAIWRCRECGEPALARLLDWAPPRFTLRVYSLAALAARDVTLYLRNVERGSCDASRARAELDALCAAAGRSERLVALDAALDRVVAAGPMPPGAAREPGVWPARLPGARDATWFAALGLEKHSGIAEATCPSK